jgi:hypothetical protein
MTGRMRAHVRNVPMMTASEVVACLRRTVGGIFLEQVKTGPTYAAPGGTGPRRIDAVAIKPSWTVPCITAYEVKVSRSDFLRDRKWTDYLDQCHRLYFACPRGLIDADELEDDRVGLVWTTPSGHASVRRAAPYRRIDMPADLLYYIVLARLAPVNAPWNIEEAYYRDRRAWGRRYLEEERRDKDLGRALGTKMARRLAELADVEQRTLKAEASEERMRSSLRRVVAAARGAGIRASEHDLDGLVAALEAMTAKGDESA